MELSNYLYEKLLNCSWLEKCGAPQENLGSLPAIWIRKTDDAIKNISSVRWENACLAEQGNLSEFLAVNYKTEYNQSWNKIVDTVKTNYMPNIMRLVEDACQKRGLPNEVLNDISFNILSIFLASYFSQYYNSEFFNRLLEIYLSGHLPCGWRGKYPNGSILIF